MLKVVMPHFPRSLCCPNQRCDFDPSTIYCVICNCPAKTTSMSGIPKLSFSRRFQWYAQSCDAMFSSISVPSQPDCIELMVRHQELLPDVSRPTSREDDSIFYKLLYCYAQDSMASYWSIRRNKNATTNRPCHAYKMGVGSRFDLSVMECRHHHTQGTFYLPIFRLYPIGESMMCRSNNNGGNALYYRRNEFLMAVSSSKITFLDPNLVQSYYNVLF